jgi:SNF2 family DNA or RNA helicase
MQNPDIPDEQQRFFAAVERLKSSKDFRLFDSPYQSPDVKLRPYQHIGVAYMLAVPRAILGDHTGLGKTGQSISTYIRLLEKNSNLKCIIVTIKSSLYQWASEIRKFTQGIKAFALDADSFEDSNGDRYKKSSKESPSEFRQRAFDLFKEQEAHLLITGYSMLVSENQNLMHIGDEYIVFFDECTQFKTWKPETKYRDENRLRVQSGKKAYLSVFQAACNVSARAQRAYGLTATPIKNRLEEAFALYKVIKPDLFPNVTWFRSNFCVYREMIMRGRRIPQLVQYKNLDKFAEIIKPFYIGRSKRDVAPDLPKIITKNVFLEMKGPQLRRYQDALDGLLELPDGSEKTPEALAKLTYCQLISNSPRLIGYPDEESSKEEELYRLLSDELEDEKVIVFTISREWIEHLSQKVPNSLKITGSVSGLDRKKAIDKFTESKTHNVIFINKAGIESINLQIAGHIVCLDLPWSYGDYLQLIGRSQRIGSMHSSIVVHQLLNIGTIDEYKVQTLLGKKNLVDRIFGPDAENILHSSSDNDTMSMLVQALRSRGFSNQRVTRDLDIVDINEKL